MSRKIGFLPIIAAMGLAVAGCQQTPAPGNDTKPVETNGAQKNTAPAQGVPTGGTCGGMVGAVCASQKDFCKMAEGQCFPDAQGTCTTKPEICTREYKPVCGCDGKTYGNACQADAAGASIQAQGECPKPGGEAAANAAGNTAS